MTVRSSRLSGFYKKGMTERVETVAAWAELNAQQVEALSNGLSLEQADKMVENVIGRFSLPLAVAANFLINQRDYLIPMAIEEPSVVAAIGNAARLVRASGGFRTGSTPPVMIAQIQLLDVADPPQAQQAIHAAKAELLTLANVSASIAAQGGGPLDVVVRHLTQTPTQPMLIVHLLFDVRDAMGANVVNTAAEKISPRLEELSGGRALLRILSNYSDQRRAWAEASIPAQAFAAVQKDSPQSGNQIIHDIAHANAFAIADPYRAATHNKGIFNGIDAVAIATGNDWRAIEAGGHAWAARDGSYRALTEWRVQGVDNTQTLYGRIELPLAVGILGGSTKAHPTAQTAMKMLAVQSASELSEVMAAVGLAQNLAALRALVGEGIQQGHMRLHARKKH